MSSDRLKIIATSDEPVVQSIKKNRREESRATFERLWLIDPDQFDSNKTILQRTCFDRFFHLLKTHIFLPNKTVVDFGSGDGRLALRLASLEAVVIAVDIASNALQALDAKKHPLITTQLDYIPRTTLPNDTFDLVAAKDLIAHLPEEEFRLFFSEVARLIKKEGSAIVSTPIDIHSVDALQRFIQLAETEFDVTEWVFSYHALWIRIMNTLKQPAVYVKASKDREYRNNELKKRGSFGKYWLKWNSSTPLAFFWKGVVWGISPLIEKIEQSKRLLEWTEWLCQMINQSDGISHAIFLGKRKPLVMPSVTLEKPFERPLKRRVWE